MKKLIIVESPGKIKTIRSFLTKDFDIISTVGHIKDLPKKEIGIEILKGEVKLTYKPLEKKQQVIKDIVKHACDSDIIYIASDPDREGEIIAKHVYDEIKAKCKGSKEIYRISFNEISKNAVLEAFKKPGSVNASLVSAQQARRVLDRWVGYLGSPVLWKIYGKGLSVGRVQSVALKLICMRENEIKNFKIEEFHTIHADSLLDQKKLTFELIKKNNKAIELKTKEESDIVIHDLKKYTYKISDIKKTKRLRKPEAPFITSTLQQAAYNLFSFNIDETMKVAQQLYEGIMINDKQTALITYMRTDSYRISDAIISEIRSYVKDSFGAKYIPPAKNNYSKEGVQDAHEAIRPIDIAITPQSIKAFVDKRTYTLYNLIWKRALASQMSNAEFNQTQILVANINKDKDVYTLKINGSILEFDGFLKLYNDEEDSEDAEKRLPENISIDQAITFDSFFNKQHFTQPPARYSQATLVKELEKEGIGRPATYAAIMRTIQDRSYTYLDEKKRFVPTELGDKVVITLNENLANIMDIHFTAKMEEQLDAIAQDKENKDDVLIKFYTDFTKDLQIFSEKKIKKESVDTLIPCVNTECTGTFLIKSSRTKEFLGCSKFPECKETSSFTKDDLGVVSLKKDVGPVLLKDICSLCSKPLQEREGKYGKFISCSGFPACKYIYQEKTKQMCPACSNHPLVKKVWKGNIFWGCQGYPTCKFSISGDIVEKTCVKCNGTFMKKDGLEEKCLNQDCI